MPDTKEDFLDDLRAVGRVESRGFFTLDPRRAREKMQQFLLADPHQCILEWIQAAVAGGATKLVVRADPQDVSLTATGWALDPEFLRQPLAGLFISQEKSELESYRHLSIGLNAALALSPRTIEVNAGGSVLRMSGPEQLEVVVAGSAEDEPVTRITCSQRWSWKLAQRAFSWLRKGVPEEEMVLERARYCPVELYLGDRRVTAGGWRDVPPPLPEGALSLVTCPYEGHFLRGVLALTDPAPEKGFVHVVKHGVLVGRRGLRTRPLRAHALVHVDGLLTTASHSDLVEDDRWKSVLRELEQGGREVVLAACRQFEAGGDGALRPHVLAALVRCVEGTLEGPDEQGLLRVLSELPLFRTTRGELCCYDRLREACSDQEGRIHFHVGESSEPLPEDELVLLLEPDEVPILQNLFGTRVLVPVTSQVDLMRRAANQQRWRRDGERVEGRLPLPRPGESLFEMDLAESKFGGVLGLRRHPAVEGGMRRPRPAAVSFFVDGRLLASQAVTCGGLEFQAAVCHGDFQPNYTFDEVEEDGLFREALRHLEACYAQALGRWLACDSGAAGLLDTDEKRLHVLDLLDGMSAAGCKLEALPSVFLEFPLLATIAGQLASLADLQRDVDEFGSVYWVTGDQRGPQVDHRHVLQVDVDLAAWYGDRPVLPVLVRLFPGRVVDYTAALKTERQALERRARSREEWYTAVRALLPVEIQGDGVRGMVGLAVPSTVMAAEGGESPPPVEAGGARISPGGGGHTATCAELPSWLRVSLLKDGQGVETRTVPFEWGPLEAVVESDAYAVDESRGRVEDCPALEATWTALHEAGAPLAVAVAREMLGFTGWRREVSESFLLGYMEWKRTDLSPELEQVPLFPCMENWRRLSLADVRHEISASGRVRYVGRRPARSGASLDPRPVLVLEGASGSLLRALVGDCALVDATQELEEESAHRAFLERPREDVALRGAGPSWVVQRPVAGDLWGLVGLIPLGGEFDGTATLRVMRDGRELTRLALLSPVPAEVVLTSGSLPVSPRWDGLATEADEEVLRRRAREAIEDCLEVIAGLPVLPHSREVMLLARYVLADARTPVQVQDLDHGSLAGRVARLPLFEDSQGDPASLVEMAVLAADEGGLRYVPQGVSGRPAQGCVVVLATREQLLLSRLFHDMVPYSAQLADEEVGWWRRQKARAVASSFPAKEHALAWLELEQDEMRGTLAVCPDQEAGVVLACDGLEVQCVALFGALPVVGVLQGPLLRPDRAWSRIELDDTVRRHLDQALDQLYAGVAARAPSDERARKALLAYHAHGAARGLDASRDDGLQAGAQRTARQADAQAGERRAARQGDAQAGERWAARQRDAQAGERWAARQRDAQAGERWAARQRDAQAGAQRAARQRDAQAGGREFALSCADEERSVRDTVPVAEGAGSGRRATVVEPSMVARHELLAALGSCLDSIPGWRRTRFHEELIRNLSWGPGRAREVLVKVDQRRVLLNPDHRLAERVLASRHDRQLIAMLASLVVTALNRQLLEVTDDDELLFLLGLCDWLSAAPPSP